MVAAGDEVFVLEWYQSLPAGTVLRVQRVREWCGTNLLSCLQCVDGKWEKIFFEIPIEKVAPTLQQRTVDALEGLLWCLENGKGLR